LLGPSPCKAAGTEALKRAGAPEQDWLRSRLLLQEAASRVWKPRSGALMQESAGEDTLGTTNSSRALLSE
jgi:hypothetical protein